jgi:prolyl-tRNA editing enzyme YbaK/EbsC (Cys-tRNA(Pro) deacylase)
MTTEENIISILNTHNIAYEIFDHEPVYTNPTMALALNVSESETVKSLVLMTKESQMVVLVLPGNQRSNGRKPPQVSELKKSLLPNLRKSWRRSAVKWDVYRHSANSPRCPSLWTRTF